MLKGLRDALETVCEVDPTALADRDGIVELHRLRARVDALITKVTAAFDAQQGYCDDGAKTTVAWVATVTGAPMREVKRDVLVGRALREMPLVEAAFTAGEIGIDHSALLASAQRISAKAFERDEELLLEHATRMRFSHFARALKYWRQHAAPDDVEDEADDQRAARAVHLDQGFEGLWFGRMTFDPISGAIVAMELGRIEERLFEEDWAEARERAGDNATAFDLRRTPAQRRADAMVEMATRSRTAPRDGRRPGPLFTVLVDYDTFAGRICELADGTVVTPGTVASWLDRAWIERIVFDGPSRVIDVGVRRRIFDGATRRAVEVRDRECFHPFCEEPAGACQVDHIEPYGVGGETVEQNGRLACGFHNRERHRRRGEPPPE